MLLRLRRLTVSHAALAVWSLWLATLAVAYAWPVEWWMTVRAVEIPPARSGAPVVMIVDRTVRRPFVGHWTVEVRQQSARGWELMCTAAATNTYRVDAVLPQPLTLHWWTGGACPTLTPGVWRIDTGWRIDWLPSFPKHLQATSNIFRVLAADEPVPPVVPPVVPSP